MDKVTRREVLAEMVSLVATVPEETHDFVRGFLLGVQAISEKSEENENNTTEN